jgi:Ca2+-binding EF-hand superfamily protein
MTVSVRSSVVLAGLVAVATGFCLPAGAQPPGGREGGRGMFRMPLMTALDTDGDGEISTKEIDEAPMHLRTLDANKDGKLTMEELRPAGGGRGPFGGGPNGGAGGGAGGEEMVNRLMEYDTDKDGKLKAEDLPERMRAIVTRADANKDGVVTRDELAAMSRGDGGQRRDRRDREDNEREDDEDDDDDDDEDDDDEHEQGERMEGRGARDAAGAGGRRRPPVEE